MRSGIVWHQEDGKRAGALQLTILYKGRCKPCYVPWKGGLCVAAV